jgi:hypothetical protein
MPGDEKGASHDDILDAVRSLERTTASEIGKVNGALGVVKGDVEALKATALLAKSKAEEAGSAARAAMVSHDQLETAMTAGQKIILDRVTAMDSAQTPVIRYVAAQMDEAKKKAEEAERNARSESMAARNIAAKRDYTLNLMKILVPLAVAGFGVVQYISITAMARQHADVTNQLSAIQLQQAQQRTPPSLQMQLPQSYPAQMAVTVDQSPPAEPPARPVSPPPKHPTPPAPAAAAPASPP